MSTLVTAHISDIHFAAMDPKHQYDILKDQFVNKISSLPKLDLICINGDLFDHKISLSSDATLYASTFIADLVEIAKYHNSTLIILQGTLSHDANQLKIYYHYMQRNDVDVRIVTNIRFETVKGCRILCIPELYNISEDYYNTILHHSDFYDICIMHGTVKGSVYGDNVGTGRLFTIDDFNNCRGPIIAGHVHKAGVFYDHIYYCGSPYRWRFDDDCFKGFILMSYNMDNTRYYLDYQEIISDIYKTISLDQLVNGDPMETIKYIRYIKDTEGINYIKVKFNSAIPGSVRIAISNQFRNDNTVSLDFYSQEQEIAKQAEQKMQEDAAKFAFLLDSNYTDEQKFVMWVNYLKNDEKYFTIEELEEMLSQEK